DEGQIQGNVFDAIISFRDELAKRGIQLLVMPAPNKASVYPEMLAARAGKGPAVVNGTTRDVLARLKSAGVEVVDLFEVYAQARRESAGPEYYLAQDSHWSPEGMRLAAQMVARRLVDLGWVEPGTAKYEAKSVPVERYGDVLKMIRVPEVERLYDPQKMDCTQVRDAASGKPYVDDPNSPVLVLGDSFLRIFERDEPGSGGFVAHLACNLGFGLSSIISDGGASTLVRQQLARKPALLKGKKVVVWEFVERDIRFGTEGWQVISLP
ncbi:MAG: alginate O-acetyltransferase AlgX-related protein, partial [Solirubrobacterales bacterium]